jgi:ABC-2 type transport system permease protein
MISILWNDLRGTLKEPFSFVVLLLLPLVLIAPAILSSSDSGGEELKSTPLMVANYDVGQVSQDLIKELGENLTIEQNFTGDILTQYELQADPRCAQPGAACDEAVGRARLADQSRQAVLIIPEGLTAAFDAGKQTPVTLLYDPGSDAIKLMQIEKVCQGLAIKVALTKQLENAKGDFTDLSVIGSPEVRTEVANITSQPATKNNKTAIHVDEVSPSNYKEEKKPGLLETTVPGYAVMFAFVIVIFVSANVREEKQAGLVKRLLSTPMRKTDFMGGKLLYGMLTVFLQACILFGVGLGLGISRGMEFGFNIPAFALIALAMSASATTLGLVFASTKLPQSLTFGPLFIGAILGGCLLSVDLLPPYLYPFSFLVPQRYAMMGFQDLLMRNAGILDILPEVGVLLLFTAVFLGFTIWRFDMTD